MKIHILAKIKTGAWGGGNQFLGALRQEFEKMGVYENDPNKAEVILFNSFPFGNESQIGRLYNLKKNNKIIIHRLAGPMFLARGRDRLVDKMIYLINKNFADGSIFQSQWSSDQNHRLGLQKRDFETTIINAPSPAFKRHIAGEARGASAKIRLFTTSWSTNPNKGFEFYKFLDDHLDFSKYELAFAGNTNYQFKNIRHLGVLTNDDLASELAKHDIFVFTSKVEACSNALLEALHCGLPAVAFNGSSNPEIIKDGNGELFNTSEELLNKIDKVAGNLKYYQNNIRVASLSEIANHYYRFITMVAQSRLGARRRANFFALLEIFIILIFWKIVNKILIVKNKLLSYGK